MLIWHLKSFKTTYFKSEKERLENAEKSLVEIRKSPGGIIAGCIIVTMALIINASFFMTMACIFTNTLLILYCIVSIVIDLKDLNYAYGLFAGTKEPKVSFLNKILLPISTAVIIYFIVTLIERL